MAIAFPLGQIVVTPGALMQIEPQEIFDAVRRHSLADWGNVCEDDKLSNDHALEHGDRLLSAYLNRAGTKFWIITEWDRSVTTILLPEDY